jgi:uncharacterized protein
MFFVMKVSKLCNLRCVYCYEYDELALRDRMPLTELTVFFASVSDFYLRRGWRRTLVFVLHGGEPLLLPDTYLRGFVQALRDTLGRDGVPYRISVQTNLTRLDPERIELLEELGVSLGVSLDVFGGQRVDRAGRDSQERVLRNLQLLADTGGIERLRVGAISVLNGANIGEAVSMFHFYRELGLDFRMLPMFSLGDPPERMRHLTLSPTEVVEALQSVAEAQFAADSGIAVFPIVNYLDAAVAELAGTRGAVYEPADGEWALIINTNGDAYNHGDGYTPEGLLGNVFQDSLTQIIEGEPRRANLELRAARARTCDECPHGDTCSRIPMIEALPSERVTDPEGRAVCAVARPMIDYLVERVRSSPEAVRLIERAGRGEEPVAVT